MIRTNMLRTAANRTGMALRSTTNHHQTNIGGSAVSNQVRCFSVQQDEKQRNKNYEQKKQESELINPQTSSTPKLDETLSSGLGVVQNGVDAISHVVGTVADTPPVKAVTSKVGGVVDKAAITGLESAEQMTEKIQEKAEDVAGEEQRAKLAVQVGNATDKGMLKVLDTLEDGLEPTGIIEKDEKLRKKSHDILEERYKKEIAYSLKKN